MHVLLVALTQPCDSVKLPLDCGLQGSSLEGTLVGVPGCTGPATGCAAGPQQGVARHAWGGTAVGSPRRCDGGMSGIWLWLGTLLGVAELRGSWLKASLCLVFTYEDRRSCGALVRRTTRVGVGPGEEDTSRGCTPVWLTVTGRTCGAARGATTGWPTAPGYAAAAG